LMSESAAKNNTVLKKYFHAQALNAVDTELKERIAEYGFDAADVAKFEGEQSTYKRVGMINKRIIELEAAKATGTDDEAVNKLKASLQTAKQQLKEANEGIVNTQTSHEAALNEATSKANNSILEYAINSELGNRQYINDKLEKSVNVTVARTLLEKKLNELGAIPQRDENGVIKLMQKEAPEMAFLIDHKELKFGSFIDETLGESNMLKVSEPDGGLGGQGGEANTKFNRINDGGDGQGGDKFVIPDEATNFYEEQLKDYPQENG